LLDANKSKASGQGGRVAYSTAFAVFVGAWWKFVDWIGKTRKAAVPLSMRFGPYCILPRCPSKIAPQTQ
jgi:hypothetical protein